MKNSRFIWISIHLVFLVLLSSCQTELEKYYKVPDWLKGNSWEVLEKKGNFTLFLEAVNRSSYVDLVKGKGLGTIMAPTDDAFRAYLTKKGYKTVADIPATEIDKLVAHHIIYYSFNKVEFSDYKPGGVESENRLPGIYYKFRTHSRDAISEESDFTYPGTDHKVKVIHKDRFLPVLSGNLFNSLLLNPQENYSYFFPNSTWGGNDGFNVANAKVLDYAQVTDNGYVYEVDQVIEPLETVYNTLANEPDYSMFWKAYDRFSDFVYDAVSTAAYSSSSRDSLYLHRHLSLPSIASEWTSNSYNTSTEYAQLSSLARNSFNIFAPDNNSLTAFYNKYWAQYYPGGLQTVNFYPLLFVLANHVAEGDVVFPYDYKLKNGLLKSTFGDVISFDPSTTKMKHICENGTLYGLPKVIEPTLFSKVSAPMFCDPKYNIFLDMSLNSGIYNILATDNIRFKVFYPTDHQIEINTTLESNRIQYINPNPRKYGSQEVQIEGLSGYTSMKSTQKKVFAGNHISPGVLTTSLAGDTVVYKTLNSYSYLYSYGNKILSSDHYNNAKTAPTATQIAPTTYTMSNGEAYALSQDEPSLVPDPTQFKNRLNVVITSKTDPLYNAYIFTALANSAGFITQTGIPYSFTQGEQFVAFVPVSSILQANFSKLPTTKPAELALYLQRYFVKVGASNLLDYPFPGAGVQGEVTTFANNSSGLPVKFTIIDNGKGKPMQIMDQKGKKVNIITRLPYIYADGALYFIDGILDIN